MPYLKQEDKDALDNGALPDTAGKLNYVITRHALNLVANDDMDKFYSAVETEIDHYLMSCAQLGYESLNAVMGVLECARREWLRRGGNATPTTQAIGDTLVEAQRNFYRFTVAPYEDEKIKQNGDVYTP